MMNNETFEQLRQDAEKLKEYAEIEDTEVGEVNQLLYNLSLYLDYLGVEFSDALAVEIKAQLENFQKNATVVETEETWTQKVVYLEWA